METSYVARQRDCHVAMANIHRRGGWVGTTRSDIGNLKIGRALKEISSSNH